MGRTVMTPEICEKVVEMREAGKSHQQIATRVGVSIGSVSHYCLVNGIDSPKNAKKVLPQTAPGPMVVKRGKFVVRHFTPEEDEKLLNGKKIVWC